MIVGLTGGIATGKSTVTDMFRSLGAYVVDADVWARRVVEPGQPALEEIAAAFGDGVLNADGSLNRKALGAIVFSDASARQRLNQFTHPRVRQGMKDETETYRLTHPDDPVIWDVPLLFEGETRQLVDKTIVVYVDEPTQLRRLQARDQLSESDARARIAAQMPIEVKRSMADYVIDNTRSLGATREQVQRVWQTLRSQADRDSESSS